VKRRGTTLLVAGPAACAADGLIAGVGQLAAIAAAPLIRVQLWARLGAHPSQLGQLLERRGVDGSGIGWEGPPVTILPGGRAEPPPLLPEVEPTSAEGLGGSLVLGLAGDEARRAHAAIARLAPDARMEVIEGSLPAGDPPTVAIARVTAAMSLTDSGDALAAARSIQRLGVKSVVVTAGLLGGLIVHGELATTYPAMPIADARRSAAAGDGVGESGDALAVFAGVLAGWCVGDGADFAALRRGCAIASAVAALMVQGGVKRVMAADRTQYLERFNRLRRTAKA
jgi:hypothetical protein